MTERWSGQSQAGKAGFSIFLWWIQHLPLIFSYLLLYPVAAFYLFFSKKANLSLIEYFQQLQVANPDSIHHRYKSFLNFGQSLVDKLAVYAGKGNRITFDFENEQELHRLASTGKGALLLGAHLGNWEIAGQLLYRIDAPIHIVMRDNEEEKIKQLLEQHSKGKSFSIIPISDDASFIITIKNALAAGGLVCMHADRYMSGMRTLKSTFLGRVAHFPFGPFFMGSNLKVPIVFVYAMKDSLYHYQFSCSQAYTDISPEDLFQRYLNLLEEKAKLYPYQWYNFYPFWED